MATTSDILGDDGLLSKLEDLFGELDSSKRPEVARSLLKIAAKELRIRETYTTYRTKGEIIPKDSEILDGLVWKVCSLYYGRSLCIPVQLASSEGKIYAKPREPILKMEFEQLFGFGIRCCDFDPERVICLGAPSTLKLTYVL